MSGRLHRRSRAPLGTAGMTLIEMIVAMVVSLILAQVAFSFFTSQGRAFEHGTKRMSVLQNHRFAMEELERQLRTLGSGVPYEQPELVYAGADVVAFNADFVTRDTTDLFAVHVDRRAHASTTEALTKTSAIRIPNSSFIYPDTSYLESNSPAETLIFFFAPDTLTARTDDFVLYRQVNGAAPAVVARNVLRTLDTAFFEYLYLATSDTAPARLLPVPAGSLPLAHTARMHGSAADTGKSALTDSIRAVRVSFTVTNGNAGPREVRQSVSRIIRLPNAGQQHRKTCGDAPLGAALGATVVTLPSGGKGAHLAWSASADEHGGEGDVLRYLLWRRTTTSGDWGPPFASIPAGGTSYVYVDEDAPPVATVQYALAAQDCTPARSSLSSSAILDMTAP
jgi:prepilin-type N-terminal cleavage/methylation domain-containing protein